MPLCDSMASTGIKRARKRPRVSPSPFGGADAGTGDRTSPSPWGEGASGTSRRSTRRRKACAAEASAALSALISDHSLLSAAVMAWKREGKAVAQTALAAAPAPGQAAGAAWPSSAGGRTGAPPQVRALSLDTVLKPAPYDGHGACMHRAAPPLGVPLGSGAGAAVSAAWATPCGCFFGRLSDSLLRTRLLACLSARDLLRVSAVSRRWRHAALDARLWRTVHVPCAGPVSLRAEAIVSLTLGATLNWAGSVDTAVMGECGLCARVCVRCAPVGVSCACARRPRRASMFVLPHPTPHLTPPHRRSVHRQMPWLASRHAYA